jgi:hypothetical protein
MMPNDYLRRDNPRLLQLEAEYATLNLPFGHTQWRQHQYNIGLETFRSDGPYLGLGAIRGEQQYRTMYDHVKSIDKHGWLDILTEDDAFGMHTYTYDGKVISRDLCDSIMELYFIEEALGGEIPARWLDIGAGYGRLAHRTAVVMPDTVVWCTDAIPTSLFLCEFYLQYRKVPYGMLPLPTILTLDPGQMDMACNIHSWSECSSKAIDFWLDKLIDWRVPYLFVVPHDLRWVCVNEDGSIGNFKNNILARGWQEIASRPKYPDGVDGLYPEVNYFMFRRDI